MPEDRPITPPYNLAEKPDPTQCPRAFCFMWHGPSSRFASGAKLPIVVSSASAAPGSDGHCACPFGICTRYNPDVGKRDWYEDHGPHLREAGLPWFYFYPSPDSLVPELRQRYIEESEALWGTNHGENKHRS